MAALAPGTIGMDADDATPPKRSGALTIRRATNGSETRIELHGELDLAGGDALEREVDGGEEGQPGHLVIDLRGLTFIDSSGIASLIHAVQSARDAGTDIALIQGPGPIKEMFEMTGLLGLLPFSEDPGQPT